jgi:hypothetical protein
MIPTAPIAVAAANILDAPINDNCMEFSPLLFFATDRAHQINRQRKLSIQFGRTNTDANKFVVQELANLQRCGDGRLHVDWYTTGPGVTWLPEWVAEHLNQSVRAVVVSCECLLLDACFAVGCPGISTRRVEDVPTAKLASR